MVLLYDTGYLPIHFYLACIVWCYHAKYIVCDIRMFTCISVVDCSSLMYNTYTCNIVVCMSHNT